MADTKITALTAITTVDPAADVLPIVDVSDTSMAASGTTKKITSNQILGAGGTATLASATISGAASAAGLSVTGSTIPTNGVYLPSANSLGFAYNSTLGMTLNSTGLGVGTVPANGIKLATYVVTDGAPATSGTTQTSGSLRIGAATTVGVMDMGTAGSYSWIQPCNATNLATNYNLVLNPNGGNVGIGLTPAGTGGCLQLKSGITFPATQVASSDANTLDDYEEGTWTIGLAFGGASTGITASANQGKYVKVGRQVTVTGYLGLTNKGSATGDATITGLPFPIANSTENYSAASLWFSAITPTAGGSANQGVGIGNTSVINLSTYKTDGSYSNLTNSNFANNSELCLSFTYFV